ncbi:MAG: ASKHA domain-containing protein [Desulfuromonadales bacterium]|nr:ASKHA domain-containing protein [Desulfuromonadales bacterium]
MTASSSGRRLLALDLGTTSLAGRLVDSAGNALAEQSLANPQRPFGADILARLQAAEAGHAVELQGLLLNGIRTLVSDLCDQAGISPQRITAAAAAGNPGISCLLRGLPVAGLLAPPHKPPDQQLAWLDPDRFATGLAVPLQLLPLVSGFVGGDLLAVILAVESRAEESQRINASTNQRFNESTLIIDVGTNGELALWNGECWRVTSVAAGPAFEGGNIGAGMLLADGAITAVELREDRLRLEVRGGGPPRGLCGSGLAALIAAAIDGGLIDPGGRIVEPHEVDSNLANCLTRREEERAIRFYRDARTELVLTQTDLRNFQLAKGAVHAGAEVLLKRAGLTAADLGQVVLTGALGVSLAPPVLKRIALLPKPMLDKISFLADGVLTGLESYLSRSDGPAILELLRMKMRPLPLSGTPAFEKHFLASLEFESRPASLW